MLKRIQRLRKKGWKKPDNTIYVGRGSRWGNPFIVGAPGYPDAAAAVQAYADLVKNDKELEGQIKQELKGKNLMCWCSESSPCHGDVLLKIANH